MRNVNTGRQVALVSLHPREQKKSLGIRLKVLNVGVSTDHLISFEMALDQLQNSGL